VTHPILSPIDGGGFLEGKVSSHALITLSKRSSWWAFAKIRRPKGRPLKSKYDKGRVAMG
jgi:hypothetical protein